METVVDKVPVSTGGGGCGNGSRISGNAGDLKIGQKSFDRWPKPRGMPGFEGDRYGGHGAQIFEKATGDHSLEIEAGRKLHEDASEFLSKARSLFEETDETLVDVLEAGDMGNGLWHFYRKAEGGRHRSGPSLVSRPAMGAIERGVDLHRGEAGSVALEMTSLLGKS